MIFYVLLQIHSNFLVMCHGDPCRAHDDMNFQLSLWGGDLGVTLCGGSSAVSVVHVQLASGVNPHEPLRVLWLDDSTDVRTAASHGIT